MVEIYYGSKTEEYLDWYADKPRKGKCQCGCGKNTAIATQSNTKSGWIRGRPVKYVKGHGTRIKWPPWTVMKSGCWHWNGAPTSKGYGRTRQGMDRRKKILAHRFIYKKFKGPIQNGLTLDHLCRNKICVNPEHLEPVTNAENCRRGSNAILDKRKVLVIKKKLKLGIIQRVIAEEFGVARVTISNIKTGKHWHD